jgi:phenylacetate-coenzyme A ligase PaaK-like adenylate-forming protein
MKTRYFFGEWVDAGQPLTPSDIKRMCDEGRGWAKELQSYPMDKVLRLLGQVGKCWGDPTYPLRATLERALPAETGFSPEMIALGMQELQRMLDPSSLLRKVENELGGIPRGGEFLFRPECSTGLSWNPIGIVLHVLPGNVFLVGAGALIESVLTGNITILKPSSDEKIFLPHFIQSLIDCDADGVVSTSIALLDYSSNDEEVIAQLKKYVDGLVIWGGEEAVKAYRNDLPARARLIVFGPKLSIAIVTAKGIGHYGVADIADKLSCEMAIWDQNSCTAPQVCYIEGEENAQGLLDALPLYLSKKEAELPAGEADTNTAIEIQKLRSIFEVAEARGQGVLRESSKGVDWTVVLDRHTAIQPSPLHRTLRIVPVRHIDDILCEAESIRGCLQTVGIAATPGEGLLLSQKFGEAGALRVLEVGQMAGGQIDDPHDGSYELPQLVNIQVTQLKLPHADMRPLDVIPRSQFKNVIDAKLRCLLDRAKASLFYARRLSRISVESVEDLPRIPILTREEMEENMLPYEAGLATGPWSGGYVARSGGSTGEPKFSIYDARDWDEMISHAVDVFRAAGFNKDDRIANCMLAGDLYGSFVSFDHVNCRLGATTFAFSGKTDPEMLTRMVHKFRINAIQAIPANLMPILKAAKEYDPSLTLEKVMFGGAPLQRSDQEWLRKVLGVQRIASFIGANDGGQLAVQCRDMTGAMHHVFDDWNYVEIVDENGKLAPDGEPGRIVITSLRKYAFPLIRYETGDAGRIVPGPCTCGRLGRRLEFLGRADDAICAGVLNFRFRDVSAALEKFDHSALQVCVHNATGRDEIVIRVESDSPESGLAEKIRTRLLDKMPQVVENLGSGALSGLTVEVHPLGWLPRNARTGKIREVCDERM